MAGLFLPCILTRCRAFILPGCNAAIYKRLQRVLHRQCNYTAHTAKQRTGLYRSFSGYLPHFFAVVWRCIQLYCTTCDTLEHITAPKHLQRIPDTSRHAGRYTGQHSRPIIIRYIRVHGCACYGSMPDSAADCRLCKPGGVSMLPTPGISMAPGWPGISLALCFLPGTAARNHWRLPPHLFSGFRPIANRGQQ